jgi:hypothetical protein
MRLGFIRLSGKILPYLPAFLLFSVSLFLAGPAEAFIIDDFSGPAIDTAKWKAVSDIPGQEYFSQHDGRLYFSATQGAEKLVSTSAYGPGFFRMEFYDFYSTNLELPGSHKGAFAALGLAVGDNFVRIIRCQNGDPITKATYGVFEVNYMIGSEIQVHYVPTTATQGQLGMYYDGSVVRFYYNTGLDPYSGWQNAGWITVGAGGPFAGEWIPGWTSDPKLFIRGYDLTYSTSFSVDNVEYRPVPEPSCLFLLAAGFMGIAAARFRKRAT